MSLIIEDKNFWNIIEALALIDNNRWQYRDGKLFFKREEKKVVELELDENYKCPVCGREFEKKNFDSGKLIDVKENGHPVWENIEAYLVEPVICPDCYFAWFKGEDVPQELIMDFVKQTQGRKRFASNLKVDYPLKEEQILKVYQLLFMTYKDFKPYSFLLDIVFVMALYASETLFDNDKKDAFYKVYFELYKILFKEEDRKKFKLPLSIYHYFSYKVLKEKDMNYSSVLKKLYEVLEKEENVLIKNKISSYLLQ